MTTYRAVVKYRVEATRDEKVSALRDGLDDIVIELVEEHGVPLDDVLELLDRAVTTAEWTNSEMRNRSSRVDGSE